MQSKKSVDEYEKDSPKKIELFSNIMRYAITGKIDIEKKDEAEELDYLNIFETMDNTKPELILKRLFSNKKNDKLLFKNFNVLSKNDLSQFGINKKLNNRDTYFYFLEYMIYVEYIEDDTHKKKAKDKTKKNKNKNTKSPKLIIDFSKGKIDIIKNTNNFEVNNKIINENENYGEMLSILNVDITKYFTFSETISIKDLRKKMEQFYDDLTFKEDNYNNMPDFQSELYYHYQLENIFETFNECNDKDFVKKIDFIKDISDFIFNVKDNKITDRLILNYFYFIMDVEYKIDLALLLNANKYEEKYDFKNCKVDKEKKVLSITEDKKIYNFDCYKIEENDIKMIKGNKKPLSLILTESHYSLKGNLLFRELTSKDGNEIYENFINSNLLKDIFQLLYEIDINSLNKNSLIELFQNNTFYFPIHNGSYCAYTNKKCFKIIIDYSVDLNNIIKHNIDDKIILFIKKSFMTLNIHHEFSHGINVVLFYINSEKNEFESPLVKLKLNSNKEEIIDEGGKLYEYLLYGRIIKKLDLKEIIYINNVNNYKKNLKKYRDDFNDLQNKKLDEVFKTESKDNEQITEIYKLYQELPEDIMDLLEKGQFKPAKLNEEDNDDIKYTLENMVFSCDKLRKSHDKHKKNH